LKSGWIDLFQLLVNCDTTGIVQQHGADEGVVRELLVVAKRGKNATESFCPVAWAEGAAFRGDALYDNFVWVADHGGNRGAIIRVFPNFFAEKTLKMALYRKN
jgi:hypothetical protein